MAAEVVSAAARRLGKRGRADEVVTLLASMPEYMYRKGLTRMLADVPAFYTRFLKFMRAYSGGLTFKEALPSLRLGSEASLPFLALR